MITLEVHAEQREFVERIAVKKHTMNIVHTTFNWNDSSRKQLEKKQYIYQPKAFKKLLELLAAPPKQTSKWSLEKIITKVATTFGPTQQENNKHLKIGKNLEHYEQ
ncbi:Hypothetical predicted protein [Paramuricea clavata]|uniref:Uncharacterized protein n=1 Tax=Paramuricea clavata TaxID=317549 RepID=A0A6S7G9T0_PARCT|nr:Hypothetical predicted protein [Paramuricea clavata]